MVIAIDFDGTCVSHEFPNIGKSIGAEEVLKALINNGHELVLNTMRSDEYLEDALEWFKDNNIILIGANRHPTQRRWTNSPKVFADFYIDDAALGCPLVYYEKISKSPFVDWNKMSFILMKYGLLTKEQYEYFKKSIDVEKYAD